LGIYRRLRLMKLLKNLGLVARLSLCSAILIAAMLGLALVVTLKMNEVQHDAHATRVDRAPQVLRVSEVELNISRASLELRQALLARNAQERASALQRSAEHAGIAQHKLHELGAGMTTDAGRTAYAPMPALMADFKSLAADTVKMIEADQKDAGFAFLADKLVPARNRLLAPLEAEKKRQTGKLNEQLEVVEQEAISARNVVLGLVLGLTLALCGVAVYVIRLMAQLGGEPRALKHVAQQVAAGNLAMPFTLRGGDTTSIMAVLKGMSASLAQTVQTVRHNAESVASASAQIATGNADLSSRTEQQASSLQQTAASMEQLGSTVRQNADSARQANQLAINSSTVASQGGEMVREVVATMRDINDSSKKIADIIGVIDGIAFQTNILALNAAVEAARAGEQGRGFAVVASEVRTLAQRSGQAAREIKSLISASVERVEQGTQQVDRAGATMQEIVGSIQRVTDIVAEISAASIEQSSGVSQVGQAVSAMDQATQQNAAMVEESAAAAESLKQQSQQLVQAMAVFKLA
jgi:methyl-accepting chemotaxis protein